MTDEKGQPQPDYKNCFWKFYRRFMLPIVLLAMLWIIGGTVVAVNGQSEWVGRSVLLITLILLKYLLGNSKTLIYQRGQF